MQPRFPSLPGLAIGRVLHISGERGAESTLYIGSCFQHKRELVYQEA